MPFSTGMDEIQRKYDDDRIVERYDLRYADSQGRRSDRRAWRALARVLRPEELAGALVLDMPCGTGRLFARLCAAGARVVGLDRSLKMLHGASADRLAAGSVLRVQGDGLQLPFRPRSFAAVLCVRFLHLLDSELRAAFLRSLAEVASGPLVAVYYPNHTLKAAGRALRRKLGFNPPERARWIPWRVIHEEIAAAGLVCTRRAAFCPVLSSGVALRLERP